MASINTIVTITITKGTQAVAVQSFGVATIFGPSARFVEIIKYYGSTWSTDMVADGFLTSDPEYIFAGTLMSQTPRPVQFGVSHFTAAVAQVSTISVSSVVNNFAYTTTINGTIITYTSDGSATGAEIQAGLIAAINASTEAPNVTATAGTGTDVVVTSDVPGLGFSITVGTNLTVASTTANHSIVQDIQATQAEDDSWYGVLVTSHVSSDIKQVAAYIETQLKVYGTSSSDSGILTTSNTDLASYLMGKAYNRTFLEYHATPSDGIEAGWIGRMFPTIPGAANWNFKTNVGITPDNLTTTQINNAQGKNANVYVTIGGVNIQTKGVVSSGEYIDVTILIDWLTATMQANVYSILVNNDKIPYTNKGIAAIENGVSQTLQQAQDNGGIAAGWTVEAPDVSQVPQADKISRTLNGVVFNATLSGAINHVNIQGFVGV